MSLSDLEHDLPLVSLRDCLHFPEPLFMLLSKAVTSFCGPMSRSLLRLLEVPARIIQQYSEQNLKRITKDPQEVLGTLRLPLWHRAVTMKTLRLRTAKDRQVRYTTPPFFI